MERVISGVFFVAILILALASAGCADLPPEESSFWSAASSSGSGSSGTSSVTPTHTYVTQATPYPTTAGGSGLAQPTYRAPPEAGQGNSTYLEIYNATARYNYTTDAFVYNLSSPPLVIAFAVTPDMVTRTKTVTSQYGSQKEETVTVTNINNQAWFTVTVRDQGSGAIVLQDGFAKTYSTEARKEVTVRTAGVYLIEMTGNLVKVDVRMRAGSP
ncbi:hypothetical protein ABH15_11755 [Methanoculleus taiwanensis]|uniref:Uncharacterized protein n=1 Tax=Methanoculleus taiwanensis TaxID=1550565 RepID=A0A498GXT2_9EURY|nr:hypothetical protein [Methanoculleus taiwanensis]RXE55412.1 hypothetical protein ABH15_11755 [Methanoculleus taiwanensis]